jgi:branched-chain amino acid transport system substrate-binding protein
MAALTNFMKDRPNIKRSTSIKIIPSGSRPKEARHVEGEASDIEIVGDELHPLLKVTDFSPYIAKIKASAPIPCHRQLGPGFALL